MPVECPDAFGSFYDITVRGNKLLLGLKAMPFFHTDWQKIGLSVWTLPLIAKSRPSSKCGCESYPVLKLE
jgi:hypothetical protein